jgi:hypothetical protein
MAIVDSFDSVKSVAVRGRFSIPNGLGLLQCGWSMLGYFHPYAGIYQTKHTKRGPRVSQMVHYRPKNKKTVLQITRQNKFALAVSAWKLLTKQERLFYNKIKNKDNISGYNFYISEYLNS